MRDRLIEVEGTDEERGWQIGKLLREEIRVNLANLHAYYRQVRGEDFSAWTENSVRYLPFIEACAPKTLAELNGMAEGADLPFEDILAMTASYEHSFEPEGISEKCTAFAICGKGTRDGGVLLGQTNDERANEWLPDMDRVIRHEEADGHQTLLYTHPGVPAYMGMNDRGLGVCWTYINDGRYQNGLPTGVILRELLRMGSLDEVCAYLRRVPHAVPNCFVLAHRDGGIRWAECFPDGVFVREEATLLAHSNHILSKEKIADDVARMGGEVISTTFLRRVRMKQLLERHKGQIDAEMACSFLSDHEGAPYSICVHGRECAPQLKTLAAMVFDLAKGEMHIAFGNPCETPFRIYRFERT